MHHIDFQDMIQQIPDKDQPISNIISFCGINNINNIAEFVCLFLW